MRLPTLPIKARLSRLTSTFLAVLVVATIAPQIANIKPAAADDGGYPWSDATYVDADYDWGYTTCPSSDTGCMAMKDGDYGIADPWVYALRNCTSYVAWKINQAFGVTNITGWGNGDTWDTGYLNPQPYPVHAASGYTPVVGDIAQYDGTLGNPAGHVAYVYKVVSGVATLDEYNAAGTGNFSSNRTATAGSAGVPSNYIHIGTAPSGSALSVSTIWQPNDSSTHIFVVESDGNVWEKSWSSGSGWTGWNDQGSPRNNLVSASATWQSNDGSTHIYAISSDSHLWKDDWTSGGGWSGWSNLGSL